MQSKNRVARAGHERCLASSSSKCNNTSSHGQMCGAPLQHERSLDASLHYYSASINHDFYVSFKRKARSRELLVCARAQVTYESARIEADG